jgi:hypothetical protein
MNRRILAGLALTTGAAMALLLPRRARASGFGPHTSTGSESSPMPPAVPQEILMDPIQITPEPLPLPAPEESSFRPQPESLPPPVPEYAPLPAGVPEAQRYIVEGPPEMTPLEWEQHVQQMLADSRGWPYVRAMGTPQTPWDKGRRGVDCSGYAQMALVRLGILSPQTPDQASSGLQVMSRPVSPGTQLPGDLAFYGRRGKGVVHVEVVTTMPGVDGHSLVQGASGDTGSGAVRPPRHALSWERDVRQPRFLGYGRIGTGPRVA